MRNIEFPTKQSSYPFTANLTGDCFPKARNDMFIFNIFPTFCFPYFSYNWNILTTGRYPEMVIYS
jgi:hypothetical protein